MIRYAILAYAALGIVPTSTHAEFIITFAQVGNDVVATGGDGAGGNGSLNTRSLIDIGSTFFTARINPAAGTAIVGTISGDEVSGTINGPSNIGSRNLAEIASSASGNLVGITSNMGPAELIVPASYSPGAPISGTATWSNSTISGLGLTPGTYTWTWGSGMTADSLEVIVPAAVPEPSSLILLGLALGVIGFGAWLRWRHAAVEPAV
jgi:hypothetical protein